MQKVYESLKEILSEECADGATEETLARGAHALEEFEQNNKSAQRSGMILGVVMFLVAVACVIGADYVADIWAEMMLVTGGVCLGGVAAIIVVIAGASTPGKGKDAAAKSNDKGQHN